MHGVSLLFWFTCNLVLLGTAFGTKGCPFNDKYDCFRREFNLEVAKLKLHYNITLEKVNLLQRKVERTEKENVNLKVDLSIMRGENANLRKELVATRVKNIQTQTELAITQEEVKRNKEEFVNVSKAVHTELATVRNLLDKNLAKPVWSLKRKDIWLSKMAKLQLNGQTPTIEQPLPMALPKNTRAVIVAVFCHFWPKTVHTYAHIKGYLQQKGNSAGGQTNFDEYHEDVRGNSWWQYHLVPWSSDAYNTLILKINNSGNGGNNFGFSFFITGYITA